MINIVCFVFHLSDRVLCPDSFSAQFWRSFKGVPVVARRGRRVADPTNQDDLQDVYVAVAGAAVQGGGVLDGVAADVAGGQEEAGAVAGGDGAPEDGVVDPAVAVPSGGQQEADAVVASRVEQAGAAVLAKDEVLGGAVLDDAVAGPSGVEQAGAAVLAQDEVRGGAVSDDAEAGCSGVPTEVEAVKVLIGCPGLTVALQEGSDLSRLQGWYIVAGRATDYERRPKVSHIWPLRTAKLHVRSESKRSYLR